MRNALLSSFVADKQCPNLSPLIVNTDSRYITVKPNRDHRDISGIVGHDMGVFWGGGVGLWWHGLRVPHEPRYTHICECR